jgi:hypothetical protein
MLRFFCLPDISLFVALVVLWDPILDPCGKSEALMRFHEFNKNSLGFFYMSDVLLFAPLVVPRDPILDPGGKSEALVGPHKIQ